MANDLPYFPFYPADFFNDENVVVMDLAEIGLYISLLAHQWREGSIPADLDRIARIVRTPKPVVAKLWPAVAPCFKPINDQPDRLIQGRLERSRAEVRLQRERKSAAGARGAAAMHQARRSRASANVAAEQPNGSRMADALQSQSDTDGNTKQSKVKDTAVPTAQHDSAAPNVPRQGRLPDPEAERARAILGLLWPRVEPTASHALTKTAWGQRNMRIARSLAAIGRTDDEILAAYEAACARLGEPVYMLNIVADELLKAAARAQRANGSAAYADLDAGIVEGVA